MNSDLLDLQPQLTLPDVPSGHQELEEAMLALVVCQLMADAMMFGNKYIGPISIPLSNMATKSSLAGSRQGSKI